MITCSQKEIVEFPVPKILQNETQILVTGDSMRLTPGEYILIFFISFYISFINCRHYAKEEIIKRSFFKKHYIS